MSTPEYMYGLLPSLPADQNQTKPLHKPQPFSIEDFLIPATALAKRIDQYVREKLSPETYRHSLRVYTYGCAIARLFPWELTSNSTLDETWFLTAMLHDIGTTAENIGSTKLSYEFWAGYHALEILQKGDVVADRVQAESIAEAIIRHQDVQEKGNISLITRLIHLGTLLDNIGAGSELVNYETIRAVNLEHERSGWSGFFSETVKKEKELKPWTMVSRIEGFEEMIKWNGKDLMVEFD